MAALAAGFILMTTTPLGALRSLRALRVLGPLRALSGALDTPRMIGTLGALGRALRLPPGPCTFVPGLVDAGLATLLVALITVFALPLAAVPLDLVLLDAPIETALAQLAADILLLRRVA